jgi:hypothetical protein
MADAFPRRPYTVLTLFGRCGSLFLHSLFDGHPLLSSIPGIASFSVLAEAVRSEEALLSAGIDEQAGFVASRFAQYFNGQHFREDAGLDRLGEGGDESVTIDPEAFGRHVRASLAARRCMTRSTCARLASRARAASFSSTRSSRPTRRGSSTPCRTARSCS